MLTSEIKCFTFLILYKYLFLFPFQIRAGKYENVEKVNKMLKINLRPTYFITVLKGENVLLSQILFLRLQP